MSIVDKKANLSQHGTPGQDRLSVRHPVKSWRCKNTFYEVYGETCEVYCETCVVYSETLVVYGKTCVV